MKRIGRIMLYMWLPAIVVAGCDDEKEGAVLADESRPEVIVVGNVDSFVQTRATDDVGNINADGLGAKYGDIYIRQREYNTGSSESTSVTVTGWGKYKVKEGAQGILEYNGEGSSGTGSGFDGGSGSKGLTWGHSDKAYVFQVLNIPQKTVGEEQSGVTIDMTADNNGRVEGTGTVTFGGGTGALASGLEYFVGGGVGPKTLVKDGQSISMTLRRQVAKVLFSSIKRRHPTGSTDENIKECTIIFPNLPKKATFSFDEFHKEVAGNTSGEIVLEKPNERIGDYVQLRAVEKEGTGVELNWKLHAKEGNTSTLEDSIVRAAYLIPFKFLKDNGNGGDESGNKQLLEEQPGFFIVKLPIDGSGTKVYTGNILGTDQYHNLRAGHYADVKLTLVDGTIAGGAGSMIVDWNIKSEADVPHHPVPGVYTEEEIELLLKALKSGNAADIPKTFYDDSEKVIRLFTNIDWSKVNIKELKIPEGFVLDGQGYNIKLGTGVEITGKGKLQDIYINGVPKSYDGTTTSGQ